MKKLPSSFLVISILLAAIFNQPPMANAGVDQAKPLPSNTINLNGARSTDPNNNISSYAWTKISGPSSFNIVNANAVQAQGLILNCYYLYYAKQFPLPKPCWASKEYFSVDPMAPFLAVRLKVSD